MAVPVFAPITVDSVTDLDDAAVGHVVACGSHGGMYSGEYAAYRQVAGIVFNDAGVGLHDAGIAGLTHLSRCGIPAAAVSHRDARIGFGQDTAESVVLHLNEVARHLGCRGGDSVSSVLERVRPRTGASAAAPGTAHRAPSESRVLVETEPIEVWVLDSASLVTPADAGKVVVTGSHGGAPGGSAARALKAPAAGAVFNHAGGGRSGAGWSRLPLLDRRGIPAVTVDEMTARIGEGMSTYTSGRIARANDAALRIGVQIGMSIPSFVSLIVASARRD